jgi:hypothetical protein
VIFILAVVTILLISTLLTKVRKKEKYNLTIATIIVLFIISIYSGFQDKIKQQHYEYVMAFTKGKTLICKSKNINNKEYNYVSGTSVFVLKDSTKSGTNLIKLSECNGIKAE